MAYEPHGPGCAADGCRLPMKDHPVMSPDGHHTRCAYFVDPEWTGEDRETEVESPFLPGFIDQREPTRSEMHGVSTAGYADVDVRASTFSQACKKSANSGWTCAKLAGHESACVTGGPVARRLEEIERVQPAFKAAWQFFGPKARHYAWEMGMFFHGQYLDYDNFESNASRLLDARNKLRK